MLTIKEIYEKRLKDSGGKRDDGRVMNFLRLFSFPITVIAYYLNISANAVSFVALPLIFIASLLMSFKDYWTSLIGCILIFFWLLLDLVDGEIARLREKKSVRGKYLEILNHDLSIPIIYFFLGLKAYNHFNSAYFIYAGIFSAICVYFISLLRLDKYRIVIRYIMQGKKVTFPKKDTILSANDRGSFIFTALSLVNDIANMTIYFIALAIFNLLQYAIFFYAPFIIILMIIKLIMEYKSGFKEFGLE
jgi:phosphatidylglycerophosphate synthase